MLYLEPSSPALQVNRSPHYRHSLIPSGSPEAPLDPDWLSDQDHGHSTVHPLPFDEQDLAHKRSDVHDLADLGIFPRQDVVADAPERRLHARDDHLTAPHQYHPAGRAVVRATLSGPVTQ